MALKKWLWVKKNGTKKKTRFGKWKMVTYPPVVPGWGFLFDPKPRCQSKSSSGGGSYGGGGGRSSNNSSSSSVSSKQWHKSRCQAAKVFEECRKSIRAQVMKPKLEHTRPFIFSLFCPVCVLLATISSSTA